MNHYSWIYVGDAGHSQKVGLYHSNKSGHLLIYVGRKVMTIDFRVFESKKYTFFIEDELVRVCLERKGDEMYYTFEIDKTADTPRNRARRIVERKYLKQFLVALGIFVALVLFAALVLPSFSEKSDLSRAEELLIKEGRESVARISNNYPEGSPTLQYQFIRENDIITGTVSKDDLAQLSPMPVIGGDEFVVVYVPSKPDIHSVYFNRPTEKQLARFKARALEKLLSLHPGTDTVEAGCFIETAYLLSGLDGLADFFFQDMSPAINPEHNAASFEKLTQSLPFRKKVETDCGQ